MQIVRTVWRSDRRLFTDLALLIDMSDSVSRFVARLKQQNYVFRILKKTKQNTHTLTQSQNRKKENGWEQIDDVMRYV